MTGMVPGIETATTQRRISARIGAVEPSATLAVDAKARALRQTGRDVIGFGAGEPDFATPENIVEAAAAACHDPANHHYTPTAGLPDLRAAIAAKTKRDSGYEVSASQVLVTNGAKQAVFQTFATLCDPGDEVLIPAPYWTTYPEAVRLAGATPVDVPTDERFHMTVENLERACTAATKVLLYVSPSNPTGAVMTSEETEAVAKWAYDKGLWIVTDEIYEHLVYGANRFTSVTTVVPEVAERCVVLNGVAKTYAMTGWRVGWMIGPADVIEAATNFQSQATSNVCNVAQRAALAAVSGDLSAVAMMRDVFDARRQTIHKMLNECEGVTCVEPEGAFYAFPSVEGLIGREIAGRKVTSSAELADIAIDAAEVAVVPGEAFGAPGYLRLSYALSDDELVEGVRRLGELFATAS
jgi:aspartate aminotransferase